MFRQRSRDGAPSVIGCSGEDIRSFVRLGCYIEHSICMFIDNLRTKQWEQTELKRLIELAGADRTILGSDLGVTEAPRPVEGFRAIV